MIEFKEVSKDDRRTIFANANILKENKEISIIKLNKDNAIGACIHKKDEYAVMIEGSALLNIGGITCPLITWYKGEAHILPKDKSHSFIALEDCIIIEWGITEKEKIESKKDEYALQAIKEFNEDKD